MGQKETLTLGHEPPAGSWTLQEVFDASYRRLVVQMYGVVGNAGEAEDLVQEAFVRASASGRRFLRVDNPEAWLRRTAVNLYRSRWRKLRNFSGSGTTSRPRTTSRVSTSTWRSSTRCDASPRPTARCWRCTTWRTCQWRRSPRPWECPKAP